MEGDHKRMWMEYIMHCAFDSAPCRKSFKSEKQFDQHIQTKKHKQTVEQLRKELEREIRESKVEGLK